MKEETSIALIKKDMEYLKTGIDEIKETLKDIPNKFVSCEKHNADMKLINEKIAPIIRDRDKIMWLVVSSVVLALLSLVLVKSGVFAK